jgi:hypothetical protein
MLRRWPLLLVLLAGCSRPAEAPVPPPALVTPVDSARLTFHTDLAAARKEAAATGKPLCVFLVLGDWNRHC